MNVPFSDRAPGGRSLVHAVGLTLLVLVVGAVVLAALPGVIGMDESYVVRSDSMSPSIEAGSVVFVSSTPAADLQVGDVITFSRTGSSSRVTHRIADVDRADGEIRFVTRGDANEQVDSAVVRGTEVIGRVTFSIPLLGYLLTFAQTPVGIVALLVVPGGLLAASEAWALYRTSESNREGGEQA